MDTRPSIAFSVVLLALLGASSLASCRCATRIDYPAADPSLPFSSAVQVGSTVYVAGHLGVDPATNTVPSDPAAEAELLLDRFAATLAQVGLTMDHLVQVQVFCSDVGLYQVWNDAYRARFRDGFPSRAFIGSGPLLRGARFEMQGIAEK